MNKLKNLRASRCLTQDALAEKLGVSRTTIANSEKELPVSLALKCEKVFKCSAVALLMDDNIKIKPRNEEERECLIQAVRELKI